MLKTPNTDLLERWRKTQKGLFRSTKLCSLASLSNFLSHEIKNILSVVISHSELGLLKKTPQVMEDALRNINSTGLKGKDMVNKILTLAQKAEPKKELVDLAALLKDTMNLIEKELATLGIKLEYILAEIPEIFCDADQLSLVFLNMATNARDALRAIGGGLLKIEITRDNQYVWIRFIDNGPGIPEEIKARLFEPFVTSKEEEKGTGLGLLICNDIIKNHEGKIEVETELGKGTTFIIKLPLIRK